MTYIFRLFQRIRLLLHVHTRLGIHDIHISTISTNSTTSTLTHKGQDTPTPVIEEGQHIPPYTDSNAAHESSLQPAHNLLRTINDYI